MRSGNPIIGNNRFLLQNYIPDGAWIDNDYLFWKWASPPPIDNSLSREQTLDRFMGTFFDRLPDPNQSTDALEMFTSIGSVDDIVGFANNFGVLVFCDHGLSTTHRLDIRFKGPTISCRPFTSALSPEVFYAPVSNWLNAIHWTRTLVRLGQCLGKNECGAESDWAAAFCSSVYPAEQRQVLEELATYLSDPSSQDPPNRLASRASLQRKLRTGEFSYLPTDIPKTGAHKFFLSRLADFFVIPTGQIPTFGSQEQMTRGVNPSRAAASCFTEVLSVQLLKTLGIK